MRNEVPNSSLRLSSETFITEQCTFPYFFFLRKEVIQPHLPIRLPCYDFTPVTGSTFDGSVQAVVKYHQQVFCCSQFSRLRHFFVT